MRVEKSRPPLKDFRGAESIITLNVIMDNAPSTKKRVPKKGDMVFEISPPFVLEVIISEKDINIPLLSDRVTVDVHKRTDMKPVIIVEAYKLVNNMLQIERFHQIHPVKFGK
jgi:hypothetical protein